VPSCNSASLTFDSQASVDAAFPRGLASALFDPQASVLVECFYLVDGLPLNVRQADDTGIDEYVRITEPGVYRVA